MVTEWSSGAGLASGNSLICKYTHTQNTGTVVALGWASQHGKPPLLKAQLILVGEQIKIELELT